MIVRPLLKLLAPRKTHARTAITTNAPITQPRTRSGRDGGILRERRQTGGSCSPRPRIHATSSSSEVLLPNGSTVSTVKATKRMNPPATVALTAPTVGSRVRQFHATRNHTTSHPTATNRSPMTAKS